jgi:hypothetical protein
MKIYKIGSKDKPATKKDIDKAIKRIRHIHDR